MTGDSERRPPGALEDAVIAVLHQRPMSVAEVRAALGGDLAHTTVMTTLVRLTQKSLVRRSKSGRVYTYSLAAPAEDLPALRAALRMRRELDAQHSDRADVLASFVTTLDDGDTDVLRNLLDD